MSYEIKIVNRELANNSQFIPENVEHLALIPDYKPFSVDDDDMIIEFNTPTGAFLEVNDVKFRISFGHDPQSNGFVVKRILDSEHTVTLSYKRGVTGHYLQDNLMVLCVNGC